MSRLHEASLGKIVYVYFTVVSTQQSHTTRSVKLRRANAKTIALLHLSVTERASGKPICSGYQTVEWTFILQMHHDFDNENKIRCYFLKNSPDVAVTIFFRKRQHANKETKNRTVSHGARPTLECYLRSC